MEQDRFSDGFPNAFSGSDEEFADRALRVLPGVGAAHVGLEARILADFDALARKRRFGWRARLHDLSALIWPGAPLWQPGAVFAAALIFGLATGALVPSSSGQTTTDGDTMQVQLVGLSSNVDAQGDYL
jgi:hypothetical protein